VLKNSYLPLPWSILQELYAPSECPFKPSSSTLKPLSEAEGCSTLL